MSRFANVLKEINERLTLPQPARSRVIIEIAADLHDLERHCRDKGMNEEDARQVAIDHCDLSDEALTELVMIHSSMYRRFLDRFSSQVQSRWERLLLTIVMLSVALFTGRVALTARLFDVASPFVWPILGITLLAVMVGLKKSYLAYLKQEHNTRRLRSGFPLMLVLAGMNLLIGIYGYWIGLYQVARGAITHPEGVLMSLTGWLLSGSAMLIVCLLSVILIALLWLVLADKISRIEQAEAAVLLMD